MKTTFIFLAILSATICFTSCEQAEVAPLSDVSYHYTETTMGNSTTMSPVVNTHDLQLEDNQNTLNTTAKPAALTPTESAVAQRPQVSTTDSNN